ncbi:MAG TPA: rod shape-determining protein MreC [Clostridia bacterium]|nr:rod shape-determining protein MreC [Clostridia bacterium]
MPEKKRFPQSFVYLLFIFALLYLAGLLGIFRSLRKEVEKALVVPLKQEVYDWQRKFKTSPESCQLRNEQELAALKAKIALLDEENQEQKRLLSTPLPKGWQFLSAKVIGFENETLTINLGKANGVKEGMVAVWEDSYLGKVSQISEGLAKIKLPTFFEERLVVKVVGETEKEKFFGKGLLVGRGEGKMRIEQILSTEEVREGDLVLASVEGGELVVGKIEEVIESPGEVFKLAQVKRLFDPQELNTIFLIRGKL